MKIVDIKLTDLAPNEGQIEGLPANPRYIDKDKLDLLKTDIKTYPELLQMRCLLVYPNGEKFVIIGGNMRFHAMQDLGHKTAPCIVIPQDTPAEKLRAYTILDNAPFGSWDWDTLANEWDESELMTWGVDIPTYDNEEIEDEDYGTDFTLDDSEKDDSRQLNFCMTEEMAAYILEVVQFAQYTEGFEVKETENGNAAGLYLICKEWFAKYEGEFQTGDANLDELKEQSKRIEAELRQYFRDALKKSGKTQTAVDKHMGTQMSGHYFGESQWMLPTRAEYDKLSQILPLSEKYESLRVKYNQAKRAAAIYNNKTKFLSNGDKC